MAKRSVTFTGEERGRIANACKTLGITFAEFVRHATLQAVDEFEGDARDTIRRMGREAN